MIKTILVDQNSFDIYNNRNIDTNDLIGYLKNHRKNVFILKNEKNTIDFNIPKNINGIINYNKNEIRHDPYNLIMKFIKKINFNDIEEVLIVTSDQELIKVFEATSINTCLIYKNMYDYMEVNPTNEYWEIDKIKVLI